MLATESQGQGRPRRGVVGIVIGRLLDLFQATAEQPLSRRIGISRPQFEELCALLRLVERQRVEPLALQVEVLPSVDNDGLQVDADFECRDTTARIPTVAGCPRERCAVACDREKRTARCAVSKRARFTASAPKARLAAVFPTFLRGGFPQRPQGERKPPEVKI